MNSHEVFIHIHQGCFAGTGAIVRLPQCQWSKPDGYGKISQCITTTKHSKARTMCIFLGIYCICVPELGHHWIIKCTCSPPSHYIDQWWLLINHTPSNRLQWIKYLNESIFIDKIILNSSPPSATYMHQCISSALLQIMVCRLFGAKPLPKPMLG